MRAHSQDGRRGPHPLRELLDPAGGAPRMAAVLAGVWRDVDAVLHPIIGQRGVMALFDRSLHLAARSHPWLLNGHDASRAELDPAALQAAAAGQTAEEAAAGGLALCTAFHGLLSSLVGRTLTERLLQGIWLQPTGDMPPQDSET